jgi:hypothetical protein
VLISFMISSRPTHIVTSIKTSIHSYIHSFIHLLALLCCGLNPRLKYIPGKCSFETGLPCVSQAYLELTW